MKIQPFLEILCPECGKVAFKSCSCSLSRNDSQWINLSQARDPINQHTETAYQSYSKNYAIFALLAYWIVWRGKIRKHVAFFREILNHGDQILDIATGEGSLTQIALFKGSPKANSVIGLDLSDFMLDRAAKRFQKNPVTLVRADVMALPFASESVKTMSCFGGLNSFPSMEGALQELHRVLKRDGICRGSILLYPESKWRQRLVNDWISKGYQTISPTQSQFESAVSKSNFTFSRRNRVGDVLLFEIQRSGNASNE